MASTLIKYVFSSGIILVSAQGYKMYKECGEECISRGEKVYLSESHRIREYNYYLRQTTRVQLNNIPHKKIILLSSLSIYKAT